MAIRVFKKLRKYDGEKTKVRTVRDVQQTATRAGQRSLDRASKLAHAVSRRPLAAF
ncbi:MAG: hypothetical protein WCF10_01005 [Polyangiales bacterium]